jgi:threonine/homoserine/homoserine lactone efflux protein
MVFGSYVRVLSGAFLMGLAAAAPMGPVNILAIRRGVIGGWRHSGALLERGWTLLSDFGLCAYSERTFGRFRLSRD